MGNNANGVDTACLPAVRGLYDLVGPADAAHVLRDLARSAGSGFQLLPSDGADPRWTDALMVASSWRREARHLFAAVRLGGLATIGDGMLLMPPGRLASDTVAQALAGRPVTDLVDHPLLDPSMTIVEAVPSDVVQCRVAVDGCRVRVDRALATLDAGGRP